MKKNFDQLIEAFCVLCDIKESAQVAAGAAIDVDDVNFSISYDERLASDRLFVFCDYGEVPDERRADIYRALLEANLFVYPSDTAVFSVSPETGRVICATRFALGSLRAEELRGAMTFLSQKAKAWRKHYFDDAVMEGAAAGRGTFAHKMAEALKAAKEE